MVVSSCDITLWRTYFNSSNYDKIVNIGLYVIHTGNT